MLRNHTLTQAEGRRQLLPHLASAVVYETTGMTVTDTTNHGDVLNVSEPVGGGIEFAAPTRTFSVNGAAVTTSSSGSLSFSGMTQIVINAAGGNDEVIINRFSKLFLPSLTVNGGIDNDRVTFLGSINFLSNASLNVDLQDDAPSPGVDQIDIGHTTTGTPLNTAVHLRLNGTGSATLRASGPIVMSHAGSLLALLQTDNGDILMEANLQATPSSFPNSVPIGLGVRTGSTISSTGAGNITLRGKGFEGAANNRSGLGLTSGARVISNTGSIILEGTGGRNTAPTSTFSNMGVIISGAGTTALLPTTVKSTGGGSISITGLGGGGNEPGTATNPGSNHGLQLDGTATLIPLISTTGAGDITLIGDCRGSGNVGSSAGMNLGSAKILTVDGDISLSGFAPDLGTVVGHRTSIGIRRFGPTVMQSTGTGSISCSGQGGLSAAINSGGNHGIEWTTPTSGGSTQTATGNITFQGSAGAGIPGVLGASAVSMGLVVLSNSSDKVNTATGHVRFIADSIEVKATAWSLTTAVGAQTTIEPVTAGKAILLDGVDTQNALGLSLSELSRMGGGGHLVIGNTTCGPITSGPTTIVRSVLTQPTSLVSGSSISLTGQLTNTSGNVILNPGGSSNFARPSAGVMTINMGSTGTLSFGAGDRLRLNLGGTVVKTTYDQLNVIGKVDLTGSVLELVQTNGFVPGAGTWTLVNNDLADPIVGTFAGLPEGSVITHAGVQMRLSYVGGTGNDVVLTRTPGAIEFEAVAYAFREEDGTVSLNLIRTGASDGPVSATINSLNVAGAGKATAGSDFTAISNQVVSFSDGQTIKAAPLMILPDALIEGGERFILQITSVAGGAKLGTVKETTVRIVDAGDTTAPTLTLTEPAANARLTTVIFKGSAADGAGIQKVQFALNGGAMTDAVTTLTGTGATASFSVGPLIGVPPGPNTVSVQSVDMRGNRSAMITRIFTFVVMSPLTVTVVGPGSIAERPFPGTSDKELITGVILHAKPSSGAVFDGWRNINNTSGTGLSTAKLELPDILFFHRVGLALEARFIANPFVASIIGDYDGLVLPSNTEPAPTGTLAANDNCGGVTLTLTSTGSFTGTIKMGGVTLPLTGSFDNTGIARFGPSRSTTTSFLPGASLVANLTLDMTGTTGKLTGRVVRLARGNVAAAVSLIDADHAHFSSSNPLPESMAGTGPKGRRYNLVLKARRSQGAGFTISDYPQGEGFGTAAVLKNGFVSCVFRMADDDAAVTFSTNLSRLFQWPLFLQLLPSKGSVTGRVQINEALPDTDMTAPGLIWFRPFLNRQWYPFGWDEGIFVDLIGTKDPAQADAPILGGLAAASAGGNASLTFTDGLIATFVGKDINISPTGVVSTAGGSDTSYTLSLNSLRPAGGGFFGSFTHPGGGTAEFKGTILQKGVNKRGFGFFLSPRPAVGAEDYQGQIGRVVLEAK